MKIAVISDIHGNRIALLYTIEDIKKLGIRKLIILGDVVAKGPSPDHVMDILENTGLEVLAWIMGNTDLWFNEITEGWIPMSEREQELFAFYTYAKSRLSDGHISFLKSLPHQQSLTIGGSTILCVHGTPKAINRAITANTTPEEISDAISGVAQNIILCGHSHIPYIREYGDKTIFNVGSVGNSSDGDHRISYGILDVTDYSVKMENRRVAYPFELEINAARVNSFPFVDRYSDFLERALI